MPKETTDIQIVDGCVRNDRRFQELLYSRFCGKMNSICLGYTGNQNDADDILQEAFIKVFKNIRDFRFECPLEAWIRRIVVNTAIDNYRNSIKNPTIVLINEDFDFIDESEFPHPGDYNYFLDLISKLPDGYRLIFNLYVIEGFSHKEIAEKIGINEGTSKSQLSRAKKYLQHLLMKEVHSQNPTQFEDGKSIQVV